MMLVKAHLEGLAKVKEIDLPKKSVGMSSSEAVTWKMIRSCVHKTEPAYHWKDVQKRGF